MPKAIDVDHEAVKAVAIVVGVREAAKQFGLKETLVLKWSSREKWFAHKELQEQAKANLQQKQGITEIVKKSQADVMLGLGDKSKLVLAHTVHKTAKQLKKAKGQELIRNTPALKATVEAGSKLHQWEQSQAPLTQVNVNVAGMRFTDVTSCHQ